MAAGIGLVVAAAHLLWPAGRFGETSFLVVNGLAAAIALAGWRHRHDRVAGWIGLGLALSFAADLVYQVLYWVGRGTEEISPADVGWVGSYVAIIAALLHVLRRARDWLDVDAWVDIATVTLVALMLQWQVVLSAITTDTGLVQALLWAFYPALDAVLVALVVRALIARRQRGAAAVLLLGGSACWLVADFLYALLAPTGSISVWLDGGWMLGAILLSLAAWQPTVAVTAPPSATSPDDHRVGRLRIAAALLPLLILPALEVLAWMRGREPNPIPMLATGAALCGLAYIRFVRLARAEEDARRQLRSRERRAQVAAFHSSDASVLVDRAGTIISDAPALAALVGRRGEATEGADLFEIVHVVSIDDVHERFNRILEAPGVVHEAEIEVAHREGHTLWLGVRAVNLLDDPDIGGVLVNVHDVTRRKEVEDQLTYQAFHDALTGLANRWLFTDRVQQALQRNARTGGDIAVIFLDLDGFKNVNDSLGHAAGDDLLCEVAQRLVGAVRAGDTVARLGGDEFAVLIEQTRGPIEEATIVADRVLAALAAPAVVEGQPVSVRASLGIALSSPDATAATLLRDADVAMYRAKSSGRGRWVVHDADMRAEAAQRLQLETDLLGVLDGEELRLIYQPVIDLATDRIVSFEALLRWEHPTLGTVPPDRFIPIAEANGMIVPIGAWVLEEACDQLMRWRSEHPGHGELGIAVNISGRQVTSPDLVHHVAAALAASGLDPGSLTLELTESTLVDDPKAAAQRLGELRALGVRLAIDDFGTGYSSLAYLRQFPLDVLKIDRSFISTINEREQVPPIVRGLLDLGRTLGLTTVAEGVELDLQRDQLRQVGCHYGQGYLFARPLPPEAASQLLADAAERHPTAPVAR